MAFLEFARPKPQDDVPIPPHVIVIDTSAVGQIAFDESRSHILLSDCSHPSAGLLKFLAAPPAISVATWGHQMPGAALAADVIVLIGMSSRRTGPEIAPGLRPFIERRVGVDKTQQLLATARIWQPAELFHAGLADILVSDEGEFLTWLQKGTRKSIGEFGTYRARRRVHPVLPAAIDADILTRS